MLLDLELDFAGNLEWRCQEHIQRVVDRPLGRIFDGNYTEIGRATLHFLEHFIDGVKRECPNRMTEVFIDGCLREGPFGPEKSDFQRFLLRETGGHDFAKQAQHFLVTHWTIVAFHHRAKNLGLALRTIIIHR